MKLDRTDQKIILELQKNGRLPYLDLAKMLNVTEGTVRNRFKKLLGYGLIRVSAIPDLANLGYGFMGIVGMQVKLSELRTIAKSLSKEQNICYLVNVTGRYDLIAIIFAKSSQDFADFMESVISNIPSIMRTETFVNLNIYKGHANWLDTTEIISNLDIYDDENRNTKSENIK